MVNEELQLIDNWMKFNRLSLNCTKSAFFLTGLNQKNNFLENVSINVVGSDFPCLKTVKHLGIVMNRDLAWTNHVHHVITKLAKAAGVLSKIRHYVDKKMMVQLYYSFVYPYLKYGIVAWGNINKKLTNKVEVLRTKILRINNFKSLEDHTKMFTLCKSMHILQIKDIFELEMAKFMYAYHNDKLPSNFDGSFNPVQNQHNYGTRI